MSGAPRISGRVATDRNTRHEVSFGPLGWRAEAKCREYDPEMFDAGPVSDARKIQQAIEICGSCPVTDQCWEDAKPGDRDYSVRGGRWPRQQGGKPRRQVVRIVPDPEPKAAPGDSLAARAGLSKGTPAKMGRRPNSERTPEEVAEARERHRETVYANKTHCPSGHEYTEENTYRSPKRPGTRHCKACARARKERDKEERRRLREEAAAKIAS